MNKSNKKEILVAAIKNGTVIDHIPTDKTFDVVNLLCLSQETSPVTIGFNYPSTKIGKKGIIKISDRFFSDAEISRLSVVAPNVVLSIIHDYEYLHGIGTRKGADKDYCKRLTANGYPKWKSNLTYAGVRVGGSSHWGGKK